MDKLTDFATALSREGLSDNTRRAYLSDYKAFEQWCEMEQMAGGLAAIDPTEYLNELRKLKVSNATINRKATALRKYFEEFGSLDEYRILRKYKTPPPPVGEPHPLPNLMDDVRAMLAVVKKNDAKLAIALMGFGGLRISEALAVTKADIINDEIIVYGKGSKIRRVPIAPELQAVLDECAADLDVDVPLIDMTDRGIRALITRAGAKAGIDRKVASHDLRMTFGTVVYNATKDLRVVQELLGHSDSKTTERYTGVTQETKAQAIRTALP